MELNNAEEVQLELKIAEEVQLSTFKSEIELNWITDILRAELSQPYSIFTYNYFVTLWPDLTIMAYHKDQIVGCIIGSLDTVNPRKGYIAMLVVIKEYRRHKVGKKLFDCYFARVRDRVDKIVLETQCINTAALNFYTKLGFFKTRKMSNYYLSGNEAYRLKLYLRHQPKESIPETGDKKAILQKQQVEQSKLQ